MKTLANIAFLIVFILWIPLTVAAQSDSTTFKKDWGKYIFIPAIEMGYLHHNAATLSGGLLLKTSLEYRMKSSHAPFFRLNYDTYESNYQLTNLDGFTNVVEGNVAFSDLLLGVGYRLGGEKLRFFVLAQSGLQFYNYPTTVLTEDILLIEQKHQLGAVSRMTIGMEYYINPKSAFSIDILYNQTWSKDYFWKDQGGAIGISIGFVTALF